jgi:hypothetical protein
MLWMPFLSGALFALVVATPAPQASPLKEIVHVRTSAFCTALRQNVAVAVDGLRADDAVIGKSTGAYARMGHDAMMDGGSRPSPRVELDQVYVEYLVGALANNLELVDHILSDAARFPAQPANDDDRQLIDIKQHLLAVADSQREALNVINGILATQQMSEFQHEQDDQMTSALAAPGQSQLQATSPAMNQDPTHLFDAGIQMNPPGYVNIPQIANQVSLAGKYGPVVQAIAETQGRIMQEEQALTPLVIEGVRGCISQP